MKQKVGFGVIGCGVISKFHIHAIEAIEEAELIGVYDPYVPAREKAADTYKIRAFDSQEELLACPDIDAVCILTPSGLHFPVAMKALEAGKHVVVEKPMALTLEDADTLLAKSESLGLKVCVISQLRFSPEVQAVRKALEEGQFGKIVSASLSMKYYREEAYYTSSSWRGTWQMDGGGALMNQGIHGVDLLQYLVGPVKQLRGICKTQTRPMETEDSAVAVLEFANGAVGTLEGSTTCYPGYPRRIEICGDKGSVVLEEGHILRWDLPSVIPIFPAGEEGLKKGGASKPDDISFDGHKWQLQNMVNTILGRELLWVDAKEGRKPLEIILAIYESSRENKQVILSK